MKIFSKRSRKFCARVLLVVMLAQIVSLPNAIALTGGPSQPESRAFEPVGTTEMVDLFTGDFTYNIPLFELPGPNGGYPFNLAYHAGIGLEDEASWTGLGWNLNPGAINRQMRGLPDEFDGDNLYTTMSIAPNITAGVVGGVNAEIFGSDKLQGGVKASFYNNSYRGLGYSIGANMSVGQTLGSGMTSRLGLNLDVDNRDGVMASPSLSLGTKLGEFGISSNYSSKGGLSQVNFSHSVERESRILNSSLTYSTGSSLSLAHPGYTPQVSHKMRSKNLAITFKAGGSFFGIFGNAYVQGYYDEAVLADDKLRVPTRSYGYLNLHRVEEDDEYVTDINREKDGLVSKETPNLGIPFLTYDIYSASGQGISGMFRPYRNDLGIVSDGRAQSTSESRNFGVDGVVKHVGINFTTMSNKSTSGKWSGGSNLDTQSLLGYKRQEADNSFEPWYFKVHGEHAVNSINRTEHLGGEKAVRFQLSGSGEQVKAVNRLVNEDGVESKLGGRGLQTVDRNARNQDIIPISNKDIVNKEIDEDSTTLFKPFQISYINSSDSTVLLDRTDLKRYPSHHWAGYQAVTADGLRYIYALPAYNRTHEETAFTTSDPNGNVAKIDSIANDLPYYEVPQTEQFLKKTEIPAYAHSYLLTSVLGPDYVDVTGDGLTEDDLGYWVKFTYRQITNEKEDGANYFAWRDPFVSAHLVEGFRSDPADDKGSFTYGKKEIWYLAKAETKTHIAAFSLSDRKDGRPPASKHQDTPEIGNMALKKLDEISLYTREGGDTIPIKKVRFEYNNALCQGIPNYQGEPGEPSLDNGGKLTLKKLWFEYGKSSRGSLNPYEFIYNNENDADFRYDLGALDRWGTFRPHIDGDPTYNQDMPYTSQDPSSREDLDSFAAAWSMSEVRLPSGGLVRVDYESDDYAYVQHKQAMAMVPVVSATTGYVQNPSDEFDITDFQQIPGNEGAKIRFPLRHPVSASSGSENPQQLVANRNQVLSYLDTYNWQLFFRIYVNLRTPSETGFYEFVEGYADIDPEGSMGLERSGPTSETYTHGYFHVKKVRGYHPFAFYTWQHLKINQPELANIGGKLKPASSTSAKISQIRMLTGIADKIQQFIKGFDAYCNSEGWGKYIAAERSSIRLKTPDKNKFGGGVRVRQITMFDDWQFDSEGVYGQYYEYKKTEEESTFSSGVAAYEPFVGGEENALRYAKTFVNRIPLKSNNNLYFEYPINESFYPGPQVGYSKVTVMSLTSAFRAGKDVNHLMIQEGAGTVPLLPDFLGAEYGITGATVNEFYTARDFPTQTGETDKLDRDYDLDLPIFFAGNRAVNLLTSSQGYVVVTNDMHGRSKWTGQYGQSRSGELLEEPHSWTRYNYFVKSAFYEGEKVFETINSFVEDGEDRVRFSEDNPNFTLGQDIEFITDMRENLNISSFGGGSANVDVGFPWIVPSSWLKKGRSVSKLRTLVTNKIIHKPGVLESVEVYSNGSLLRTDNLSWDRNTGNPVLTTVNNNFDEPIYKLQIPAFRQYAGMGASYLNSGFKFTMTGVRDFQSGGGYYAFETGAYSAEKVFPGDELMLFSENEGLLKPVSSAVFIGEKNGDRVFYARNLPVLDDERLTAKVVRSGYRNHLETNVGSITGLQRPISGDFLQFQVPVQVPKKSIFN